MRRLCLALVALALWGGALARFEWRDVVQQVEIQANGDVLVTDERTLWTDEDFGEAFICVRLAPGQTLTLLEGSSLSGFEASGYQQACESGARGQEVVVEHEQRIREGRVRFVYRLENTLEAYSDVVQWYWQILEQDHPPVVGYRLTVRAPGPMSVPYDAYVHRFANPEEPLVTLSEDRSTLQVGFQRIPDGAGVEIRYLMDPALFSLRGAGPGFEALLRDEAEIVGLLERNRARDALLSHPAWGLLALAIVLALAYGVWGAYRRYGKEPNVGPTMRYPFEPPSDLPPAAVTQLASQRSPNAQRAFHATIMDLARRGYGEFSGKDRKFEMVLELDKSADGLTPFEASVLSYLRGAAKSGPKASGFLGLQARPQNAFEKAHLEFDELKRYSQKNLSSFMQRFGEQVKRWTEARFGGPLTSKESRRAAARWFGLGLLGAATSFGLQWLTLGPAKAMFIAGAALCALLAIVAALALPAWRKELAPEIYGWQGFKRTLSDYTVMKDAPNDFFKLWDRYYVYAAALGVAQRFLKNLQRAAPLHDLDEASMVRQASWMGGSANLSSLSALSSSINSLSSALTSASASASSGGSSSGGGGGGGGGSSGGR